MYDLGKAAGSAGWILVWNFTLPPLHGIHSNLTQTYLGVFWIAERKMTLKWPWTWEMAGNLNGDPTKLGRNITPGTTHLIYKNYAGYDAPYTGTLLRVRRSLYGNITPSTTHLIHELGSDWTKSDKMAGNLNAKLCAYYVSVTVNLWYPHNHKY